MAVEIIDSYYLVISLILTFGFQLFGWALAVAFKTETFYDFFGGLNYSAVALMSLWFKDTYTTRQVVVTSMVVLSRAELAVWRARIPLPSRHSGARVVCERERAALAQEGQRFHPQRWRQHAAAATTVTTSSRDSKVRTMMWITLQRG